MTIEDTIQVVLRDIQDINPKLAQTIDRLGDNCFKTVVKNNKGEYYTIIDFTTKQIYDAQTFIYKSHELYKEVIKYKDVGDKNN